MQSSRIIVRRPAAYRIVNVAPPTCYRDMSGFGGYIQPFYAPTPRPSPFASLQADIALLFRLLDSALDTFTSIPQLQQQRPFKPQFEVRETESAYEVRGEIPGVESEHLEVGFTDARTLVIKGNAESQTSSVAPPASEERTEQPIEQPTEQPTEQPSEQPTAAAEPSSSGDDFVIVESTRDNDTASVHSDSASSYHKATVEDEATGAVETSTNGAATPPESVPEEQTSAINASSQQPKEQSTQSNHEPDESSRRVSERQSRSFQRTFKFPFRVDQESVKASLKDAVLTVTVPKLVQGPRRINIE